MTKFSKIVIYGLLVASVIAAKPKPKPKPSAPDDSATSGYQVKVVTYSTISRDDGGHVYRGGHISLC
jgi:hypothetical protein